MRVTNKIIANVLRKNLEDANIRLLKRTEEVITGKKINKPSDDPVGILASLLIRKDIADNQQYQRNISFAQSQLRESESVVANMIERLQTAWEYAVQMANDFNSREDRISTSYAVDQMLESVVSLANISRSGKYIFAGTQDTVAPYVALRDSQGRIDKILTTGTSGDKKVAIDEGVYINVNLKGEDFIHTGNSVFDAFISFRDDLISNDTTAIRESINELEASMNQIINAQSVIGSRMVRIDAAGSRKIDEELSLNILISDVEDIDISQAITNLEMERLTYQVALQAGADIIQPTLASFLR